MKDLCLVSDFVYSDLSFFKCEVPTFTSYRNYTEKRVPWFLFIYHSSYMRFSRIGMVFIYLAKVLLGLMLTLVFIICKSILCTRNNDYLPTIMNH